MSLLDFEIMCKPLTEDEIHVPSGSVAARGQTFSELRSEKVPPSEFHSERVYHNMIEKVNNMILPHKNSILLYGGNKMRKTRRNRKK